MYMNIDWHNTTWDALVSECWYVMNLIYLGGNAAGAPWPSINCSTERQTHIVLVSSSQTIAIQQSKMFEQKAVTCFFCIFCISSYSTLCCSMKGGSTKRASDVPNTHADLRTSHTENQSPFSPKFQRGSGTISVRPTSLSITVSSTSSNWGGYRIELTYTQSLITHEATL